MMKRRKETGQHRKRGGEGMFISKGCLKTILENLSVLNKEVECLKRSANPDAESKLAEYNETILKEIRYQETSEPV